MKNKEENNSTHKKKWVTPQIEIISRDTIKGGAHHNALEGNPGYSVPGHPGQTTSGYS